jgi:hypothetical protein
VGTVTTGAPGTSASVTNSGASGAAVLNFTIPRGATGATGPQGPAAPQPTGASPAGIPYTVSAMELTQAVQSVNPVTGAKSPGLSALDLLACPERHDSSVSRRYRHPRSIDDRLTDRPCRGVSRLFLLLAGRNGSKLRLLVVRKYYDILYREVGEYGYSRSIDGAATYRNSIR